MGRLARILVIVLASAMLAGCGIWAGDDEEDQEDPWWDGKNKAVGVGLNVTKVPAQYVQAVYDAGSICPEAPPHLIAAQIFSESGWNPNATSPANAQGIAQFIPGTWREVFDDIIPNDKKAAEREGRAPHYQFSSGYKFPANPSVWNAQAAIRAMGVYDCHIVYQYVGDLGGDTRRLMLAGYNAGPPLIRLIKRVPHNGETEVYVEKIIKLMAEFLDPKGGIDGGGKNATEKGILAAEIAKSLLSAKYVWGAKIGPEDGNKKYPYGAFDCSGLVQYVYQKLGVNLPRTAVDQITQSQYVTAIDRKDVQIGDLIGFDTKTPNNPDRIDHIGIMISATQMVHASNPRDGVKISDAFTGHYGKFTPFIARPKTTWTYPLPAKFNTITTKYKSGGSRWVNGHTGIDFGSAGINGEAVYAVGEGTVESAGKAGAFGNEVIIRHADNLYTQYGHMSSLKVTDGQRVSAGQQIGVVGSTGNSSGPHLHFEVRTSPKWNTDVDPAAWLRAKGLKV